MPTWDKVMSRSYNAGNVMRETSLKKSSSVEEPKAASVGWGAGVDHSGMSSARGNALGWQWFKDPRLDCLGFRGIFPSDTIRQFLTLCCF
ncbi:hypothetical protein EV1_023663 [Malus domestica]